jgi:hypothetical protein
MRAHIKEVLAKRRGELETKLVDSSHAAGNEAVKTGIISVH